MPVVLPITATGRPKRDLIEMMREFCGQAGFDFELTPEEVASDMRLLDVMMADPPFNLMGYNVSSVNPGVPEEPCGLLDIDVMAVVTSLAQARCPGLGASLSPDGRATMAKAINSANARYASIPTASFAPGTPRGSGSWRSPWWPYVNETA